MVVVSKIQVTIRLEATVKSKAKIVNKHTQLTHSLYRRSRGFYPYIFIHNVDVFYAYSRSVFEGFAVICNYLCPDACVYLNERHSSTEPYGGSFTRDSMASRVRVRSALPTFMGEKPCVKCGCILGALEIGASKGLAC